ncbi:hypothetical protein HWI79_1956 [Cryptosporidium felis]|nr:hypothetical protein HWI79_1956 [Cryptosporidium felis]
MYLEKEDFRLLNGSFFRVNFKHISQNDLKNILKACGLKSAASSSNNQQISLLEGIRKYLLTGDLSELKDLSKSELKGTGSKRPELNYKNIINEDFVTVEFILKSLRRSPLTLEKIMLTGSASTSEVIECCSRYLDAPKGVFVSKPVMEKIGKLLVSLSVSAVVE